MPVRLVVHLFDNDDDDDEEEKQRRRRVQPRRSVCMSRAIQRLMKDYRKAEKLAGNSSNEPMADFASVASLTTQTYAQQMAHLRRDPDLTQDERKYLVAVERKTLRVCLRQVLLAARSSSV